MELLRALEESRLGLDPVRDVGRYAVMALRESEARLRAIVDNSPIPMAFPVSSTRRSSAQYPSASDFGYRS